MWVLQWALTSALALLALFSPLSTSSLARSRTPLLEAVPYAFPIVVSDIVLEILHAGYNAELFLASLALDPVFLPSPYQELLPALRPLGLPVVFGPPSAFATLPAMEATLSSLLNASSPIDDFIELSPLSATSVEYFEPTKTLRLPYKFDDADPTIPTAHPASRLLSAAKSQYGLSYFATYSVDCPASLRVQRTSSASIPISSAFPTARRSVYSGKIASTAPSRFFWWTLASSLSLILVLPSAVGLNNWLKKTDISNLDPQETFGYIPTSPVELTFILPEDSMTFLELALEISNSSNVRVKFVHLASTTPTLVDQPLPCTTFSPRQDISLGAVSAYSLALFAPYAMERDDLPPSLLVEDDLSYNMPLVTVERTCRELVRFSATESALDGSLSSLNLNVDIAASLVSQVAIAREVQWAITRATFDIQLPYGVMSIVNNLSSEISILPRLFALKSGSREWDTVAALEVILVAFKIGASGRVSWTCYTIFRFTVIRQQLFRQRVTLISIFAEVLGLVRFDHIKWTRETTCDTTSRQRSTILSRQDLDSSAIEAAGSPDFSEDLSISSNAVPTITGEGPARRRRRHAPGHRGRRAGEHVRNYVKAAEAAAADVPNSSSADGKEEIQLEEMPQTRTTPGPSSSVSGSGSDSQQSPTSPPGRPRRSLAPSALFKNSLGSLGAQSHRA